MQSKWRRNTHTNKHFRSDASLSRRSQGADHGNPIPALIAQHHGQVVSPRPMRTRQNQLRSVDVHQYVISALRVGEISRLPALHGFGLHGAELEADGQLKRSPLQEGARLVKAHRQAGILDDAKKKKRTPWQESTDNQYRYCRQHGQMSSPTLRRRMGMGCQTMSCPPTVPSRCSKRG